VEHGDGALHGILSGLIKRRRLGTGLRRAMAVTKWPQVVGAVAAKKSWAIRLVDGTLTVGVSDHAWVEQLALLKPAILSRYIELMGRGLVKDIEFQVLARRRKKPPPAPATPPLHPTSADPLVIEPLPDSVLEGITNPDVIALLGPALARMRAQRVWKEAHGWRRCAACGHVTIGTYCVCCGAMSEE
jgi:predicted nucleic acid-binding Zn ribbon protein